MTNASGDRGQSIITSEHVTVLKALLLEIAACHHGNGDIRIVVKGGEVVGIWKEVPAWSRPAKEKDDGC